MGAGPWFKLKEGGIAIYTFVIEDGRRKRRRLNPIV